MWVTMPDLKSLPVCVRVACCIKLSMSSRGTRACLRCPRWCTAAAHYAGSWSFLPLSTEAEGEGEWVIRIDLENAFALA